MSNSWMIHECYLKLLLYLPGVWWIIDSVLKTYLGNSDFKHVNHFCYYCLLSNHCLFTYLLPWAMLFIKQLTISNLQNLSLSSEDTILIIRLTRHIEISSCVAQTFINLTVFESVVLLKKTKNLIVVYYMLWIYLHLVLPIRLRNSSCSEICPFVWVLDMLCTI